MRLAAAAALILLFSSAAYAEKSKFVPSSVQLTNKFPAPLEKSRWSHTVCYVLGSDYAENRKPRSYGHMIAGTIGYEIDKRWSLGADLGLRAETIDGQIDKEEQQTYAETVSPQTEFSVAFGEETSSHSYSLAVHGQPLWTEDARREGHQGLIGAGSEIKVAFFKKRYSMSHALDGTSLINTFHYDYAGNANPDYFWTYRWRNDLRLARTWKLSYVFGAKVTRYLDGFMGYTYNNTTSITKTWQSFQASVNYDNGGFTDDGYVRMWYVDQYRRIVTLKIGYAF